MPDLDIAQPLATALAAKGYDSLTPVQEAVLAAETAGRDMLVSAQTGSGKTVAFGIAIAPEVLGQETRLQPVEAPLALVIAPTRELAQQVARELEWLYADAGAQIATCVGGMDFRNERRALDRGPHIVVGTPGRLRDHIERSSLKLGSLRAAVLDEADEMLDLGFRDDLEFILGAAPDDRRTLMFSATVPPAISALAKDFQKDALRLQTAGESRQHGDIQYRALTATVRDREHATFNLLRYYEAQTAIVFCKTRANVNHLLARMGNRGFQVVALSGELSQTERMHALQALRDGRARVCIATDVAARGIDLPGLELVVHFDLPTNADTLLHRSGRTGRAGAKGVSALIVTPKELKKAQRLLGMAKVVAEWDKAPSADDVRARDDVRIMEHPSLTTDPADEAELVATLLEKFGAERVAAAFVRNWRDARSAPEELVEMPAPSEAAPRPVRDQRDFGPSIWFNVGVGHTGRAEARWLLPKICEAGGITRDAIGAIRVQQEHTFVQIAVASAPAFGDQIALEDGLMMTRLEGEPNLERPEYTPRPPREARPPRAEKTYDAPRAPGEPAAVKPYSPKRYEPKPRTERADDAAPARPKFDKPSAPYSPKSESGEKSSKRVWKADSKKPAPRADGDKPKWSPDGPAKDKSAKPRWNPDDKAASKGKRPPRPAGTDGKPKKFGDKPSFGGKPASGGAKPYAGKPKGAKAAGPDARDTSKRFVRPSKPKPRG